MSRARLLVCKIISAPTWGGGSIGSFRSGERERGRDRGTRQPSDRIARLAPLLLLVGNAPSSLQIFVEQGVAPGKRTEVLMLNAQGGYSGITSIAKQRRRDRGQLNTERGYWFYCGSWAALPGGKVAVHRQLVESFNYLPPPQPGRCSTTVFAETRVNGVRRLAAGGMWIGVETGPRGFMAQPYEIIRK